METVKKLLMCAEEDQFKDFIEILIDGKEADALVFFMHERGNDFSESEAQDAIRGLIKIAGGVTSARVLISKIGGIPSFMNIIFIKEA